MTMERLISIWVLHINQRSGQIMSTHKWYYLKNGLLGEEQMGPFDERLMKDFALKGELQPNTKISSPTRTKEKWIYAKSVSGFLQLIERGNAERLHEKQIAKETKLAEKKLKKEAKNHNSGKESNEDASEAVLKINNYVRDYLTSGEEIEFTCMQQKPIAFKADAIVVTNRRLMVVRPKLLGRFEFNDLLWRDLKDAHVEENVIGATFSITDLGGNAVTLNMLRKKEAKRLYQICQEREEQAIEFRRNRRMQETAAGAAQVVVQPNDSPTGTSPSSERDPMARLKKLKEMLEAGLIEQDDFEKRKNEILSEI